MRRLARVQPVVEPGPVSEPEEDPEEDPKEDQVIPVYASDNAAQEEVELQIPIMVEAYVMVKNLTDRNLQLEDRIRQVEEEKAELETRVQHLRDRKEEVEARWEAEMDTYIRVEDILRDVEREVRTKKRKMDRMEYAFRVAFGWLWHRINHHPTEMGQTWYTISQNLTSFMTDEEYDEAVRRGLRG